MAKARKRPRSRLKVPTDSRNEVFFTNESATKTQNAQWLHDKLEEFMRELLVELDQRVDKRLVRIFLLTL
jgi:hypothetical protein